MSQYLIRKIASIVPTVFILMVFTFLMLRAAPGNFAYASLRDQTSITPAMVHQAEVKYGLDKPLVVQFGTWFGGALHGQFGKSFYFSQSVDSIIKQRLPITAELAIGASVIGIPLGLIVGVMSASRRGSSIDLVLRFGVLAGITVPNFVLGIVLLYILFSHFHYSPPLQYASFSGHPTQNLREFMWPVFLLATPMAASIARLTRSQVLEVLREDYVRTARAKGLRSLIITFRHVLPNSLLPVVALIASIIGLLFSGTVIVEQLFALPGIGTGLLLGVQNRDYPLVEGIVLLLAFAFFVISFLLDWVLAALNPRIRLA